MQRFRSFVVGCLLAVLAVVALDAQPLATQIQIAINRLTTGVTPFTQLALTASSYINWGTTLGTSGYGIRDNAGVIEFKNSAGSWIPIGSGTGAPADASFWTRVSEASLTNETVMGALGTGLVINTTTTGVPTIYAGVTCTNQFLRALSAIGASTCASVSLTADVTGTLPVANGGTGLTSGTSGGVPYYSASNVLASSGALSASQIVLGGGAGASPTSLAAGTSTTLLHGNAAGSPTFSAVSLTADITGILLGANGGTSNGFFAVSGPTTSLKTFAFPDVSATVLTTNAAVTPGQGGTGISSYTIGDIIYASGATTLSALAGVATGNALISGGVATAPSWGKIALTTHVSGTLPAANGGTGIASYAIGDLLYATGATSFGKLADVAVGSYLRAGGVTTAPLWSTATLPNTATAGDVMYASAANTYANLTAVAVGQVLGSGGVATAPAWTATPQLTSLSLGGTAVTFSGTAPSIASGFGTSPSIAGTATAMRINVGTGGTASAGVITMPASTTVWNCHVENLTGTLGNYANQRTVQISSTTTSVSIENQTISTGAVLAWTASDVVALLCGAY